MTTMRMADCHPDRERYAKGLCAPCYKATRYVARREEILVRQREYDAAHREKIRAYRAAHREEYRAYEAARTRERTPAYRAWEGAKQRTTNPNTAGWASWGGRGIRMWSLWLDNPDAFIAHLGPWPGPGYSLDRIDNDLGYFPRNIRWATRSQQRTNQRPRPISAAMGLGR